MQLTEVDPMFFVGMRGLLSVVTLPDVKTTCVPCSLKNENADEDTFADPELEPWIITAATQRKR